MDTVLHITALLAFIFFANNAGCSSQYFVKEVKASDSFAGMVAFSPDGTLLASGGEGTVKLWKFPSMQIIDEKNSHSSDITSLAFSPDGNTVASGSFDKTVDLWDISSKKNNETLGNTETRAFLGTLSHEEKITLPLTPYQIFGGLIYSVAFSPDGKLLAVGMQQGFLAEFDNPPIKIYDLSSGKCVKSIEFGKYDNYNANSVAFSPDGKFFASGGEGHGIEAIHLWDSKSFKQIASFREEYSIIDTIAFNPNGKILASGGYRKPVQLWDVESKKCVAELKTSIDNPSKVKFDKSGAYLIVAGDGIEVWNVKERKRLVKIKSPRGYVKDITLSPDGNFLVGSSHEYIMIWDVSKIVNENGSSVKN